MTSASLPAFTRQLADKLPSREECIERTGPRPDFGSVFTQHMVVGDYDRQSGWHNFRVVPLTNFSLHPATSALHYGQAIFEGMKAYAQPDGSVAVFRPRSNAERFIASAQRLGMPPLPADSFLEAVRQLVSVDRNWVPAGHGDSLYLRPLMFARDARLTTRPSSTYTFVLMACPVGAYFPSGVAPVSVWLSEEYVRAVRGGTGEAKCAGNYAASFLAQQEAVAHGCDQVVWLDAIDRVTIEEMGGMNLYFVLTEGGNTRLVTPPPTGSLLKGVTRSSLLEVAQDLGYSAEERPMTIGEWEAGCRSGAISESFACGTAAVVSPIGLVKSRKTEFRIGSGKPGPVTMDVRKRLLDIQHGIAADGRNWMQTVASA